MGGPLYPFDPNDPDDADNRTAAEHYIFVRLMRSDAEAPGYVNAFTGFFAPGGYYVAKKTHAWQFLTGRNTSPASLEQAFWGVAAWWDSFRDNFNKFIDVTPGQNCGCTK